MAIKRVPIRSPLQRSDLTPVQKTEENKAAPLDSFSEIGKLIDQLTSLREQLEEAHTSGAFKGEKGERGEKGESVFSPEDFMPYVEYMIHMVQSAIVLPKDGVDGKNGMDGYSPVFGVDYFTPAHKQQMLAELMKNIRQPKDGETPVIDHEQLAIEVAKHLTEKKMLKKEHIDGLDAEISSYRAQLAGKIYGKDTWARGGGDTIAAGSGITVTANPNGTKTIAATGSSGTPVYNETVSGSGTSWTLANTPVSGTLRLFANGQRLTPGVGNDYTLSGTTITTANSFARGSLLADYSY